MRTIFSIYKGSRYLSRSILEPNFFSLAKRGILFYEGIEEPFLVQFFRLEDDFDFIEKEIDQDPVIHQAIKNTEA